jgi:hypothetical protein
MAAANSTTTTNTAQDIEPVFKRVGQIGTHDCIFACVATIAGKTLEEVIDVAVNNLKQPRHGAFWPLGEEQIALLMAKLGFVSTVYKQITKGIVDLPAVAIVVVDYNEETELGRHAIFVRDSSNMKAVKEYIIDPAWWIAADLHVRNDFKNLGPAWFIAVHPMVKPAATK